VEVPPRSGNTQAFEITEEILADLARFQDEGL